MSSPAREIIVYIVDDDHSVSSGLTRLMRAAGIQSRAYSNPETFLDEVCNNSSGCILMDITMPRMNGVELAARLRERGITMPVIALSARDDIEMQKLISDIGVRFYLRKPVDDQALIDAIHWVTRNQASVKPVGI